MSAARPMTFACGALVLALSCADAPSDLAKVPATAPFVGGTRLRATYLEVDDLRILWKLRDTELGRECTLGRWGEDGVRYCLPAERTPLSREFFVDANCSDALLDPDLGCMRRPEDAPAPIPDYILVSDPEEERIFARGEETAPSYGLHQGRCILLSSPDLGRPLYRRGPAVPISSFVATHDAVVETGGRLAVLARRGSDGALFRAGSWDTRRREAIRVVGASDAPPPWTPARTAFWIALFHDAECTQQAAYWPGGYPLPLSAVERGGIDELHEIGARVDGALYRLDESGACVPKAPAPDARYYKVGTAIPLAALEPSRVVEVGTGRLHALYRAGTDGTPIEAVDRHGAPRTARYRDAARDEVCSFVEIPDGTIRCLPASDYTPVPWLQTGAPLAGASEIVLTLPRGTVPPRAVTYRASNGGCALANPLSVPTTTPVVYVVGEKVATSSVDIYALTETIPLDSFVAATLRQD